VAHSVNSALQAFDLTKLKLDSFSARIFGHRRKTPRSTARCTECILWGTDGLVVNAKRAQVADYTDLCRPDSRQTPSD